MEGRGPAARNRGAGNPASPVHAGVPAGAVARQGRDPEQHFEPGRAGRRCAFGRSLRGHRRGDVAGPPARPPGPRIPAPFAKLALMRADEPTVSFYRYLYETVGTPWLWFERRLLDDVMLAAEITKQTTEIFVLYVGGVPAGYFELDVARARETEL